MKRFLPLPGLPPQATWRSFARAGMCAVSLVMSIGCRTETKDPTTEANPSQNPSKANASKTPAASLANQGEKRSEASQFLQWITRGSDIGIDFKYQNGEAAWLVAMIESNGGGVAMLDFDNDGKQDVFLPGGGLLNEKKQPIMVHNGLFQQTGTWAFRNVARQSGSAQGVCYSFGASAADYNGDGLTDLFVTGYNGQQLLQNKGDGTFEDATAIAGFYHKGWSSSAAWGDFDGDGDLDLYVAHYGVYDPATEKKCFNNNREVDRCAPADFPGEPDELWMNEGNGSFREASQEIKAGPYRGIGVVACDWDGDRKTDLYVTNDEDPNTMFVGAGDGTFQEIGAKSGTFLGSRSIVDGSMGIGVGDFDGNLKPDLFVTNYQNEYCELYLNQGRRYFSLGTRSAGLMALGQSVVGWGTAFLDADHDGDEDVMVVAGHTSRKPISSSNLQKSYFLENVQNKRLVSAGESMGDYFQKVHAGRGMAIGDLDGDGDTDAIVSMLEQPCVVLENAQSAQKSGYGFLQIDLIGVTSNRDAIGATVELETERGKQVRFRISGGSYASTHTSTLHFGLREAKTIKQIVVRWPSGRDQIVENININQRITIVEGD